MILVSYKIKIPSKKAGIYEVKEDFRLLLNIDTLEVAQMEIKKKFPTAYDFLNKTM